MKQIPGQLSYGPKKGKTVVRLELPKKKKTRGKKDLTKPDSTLQNISNGWCNNKGRTVKRSNGQTNTNQQILFIMGRV